MYFLPAWQSITLGTTGAWTALDLTGAPFSVPATAAFAILRRFKTLGWETAYRRPGSSFAYTYVSYGEGGNDDYVVPLSGGAVEYYTDAVTGANRQLYLVGYLTAQSSVSVDNVNVGTLAAGWQTIDLSSIVPSASNWAVLHLSGAYKIDIRKTGSGVAVPPYNLNNTYSRKHILVPVDSLGRFDIWAESSGGTIYYTGHCKLGEHNEDVAGTDVFVPPAPPGGAWTTFVPSVAASAVVLRLVHTASFHPNWRALGMASAGTGHQYPTILAIVPLDSSNQMELWSDYLDGSTYTAYTVGYLSSEVADTSDTATAADTIAQDLYTPDALEETATATDTASISGEDYVPDALAESATAADTLAADRTRDREIAEAATAADTLVGDRTTLGSGAGGVTVSGSGEGITGDAASGAGEADVSGAGAGITGGVASGEGDVSVGGSGTGLVGASGEGEGQVRVTGSGTGAVVEPAVATPAGQQYQTFAMNLATGAVTEHSTAFNSRCEYGGQVYAAGPDGIHLIGGKTDAGTNIVMVISKSGIDFGSSLRKRIADYLFKMRSSGDFDLTVFSESDYGTVILSDGIEKTHGAKSDLPKGIVGRMHGFTLQNRSGAVLLDLFEAELLYLVSEHRRGRQSG